MKSKTIYILTETSDTIGYGHFYQCLAIARMLRKHYFNLFFLVNPNPRTENILKKEGFAYCEYHDSFELKYKLSFVKKGIILINLRWIVPEIMDLVKKNDAISIIIDELGEKKIIGDFLLNGSLIDEWHKYEYPKKTPITLFGPKFLIVTENFSRFNICSKSKRGQILICMGGVDRSGTTLKIIKAVENFKNFKKCVIIGPGFFNRAAVEIIKGQKNSDFEFIEGCNDLSELMFNSDIIFSAGGDTLHEAACVGTPAIVLWEDDHERIQAESFVREGCAVNLGKGTEVSHHSIEESLQSLLENEKKYQKMSENGKNLVDGKGILRLVQIIEKIEI